MEENISKMTVLSIVAITSFALLPESSPCGGGARKSEFIEAHRFGGRFVKWGCVFFLQESDGFCAVVRDWDLWGTWHHRGGENVAVTDLDRVARGEPGGTAENFHNGSGQRDVFFSFFGRGGSLDAKNLDFQRFGRILLHGFINGRRQDGGEVCGCEGKEKGRDGNDKFFERVHGGLGSGELVGGAGFRWGEPEAG